MLTKILRLDVNAIGHFLRSDAHNENRDNDEQHVHVGQQDSQRGACGQAWRRARRSDEFIHGRE